MNKENPKDLPWTLGVKLTSTGAVTLFYQDGELVSSDVYRFFTDNTELDAEEKQRFLFDIMDAVDGSGSRYDKERIRIKIEHGDKYICSDLDCKICKEKLDAGIS